jgi:hypothetical protein
MFSYNGKVFKTSNHNDFETPSWVIEELIKFIPDKYKIIYDSAFCSGTSGEILKSLLPDKKIIHENTDFFEYDGDYDIQITNPPYQIKKEWLEHTCRDDKPFMLLMPAPVLFTKYWRELFKNKDIQLIIPHRRISYVKCDSYTKIPLAKEEQGRASFDTCWFCYKCNLPHSFNFY